MPECYRLARIMSACVKLSIHGGTGLSDENTCFYNQTGMLDLVPNALASRTLAQVGLQKVLASTITHGDS
ncbi:hypothetical protein FQA39_LY07963 [Lamprigera yunnana]|nr:hypothetical protein FQA39_LY07963 [Lamprigera yunnana]